MMKVKGIEIEEPPYPDDYLDECLNKVDLVIDLNFAKDTNQLDAYVQAFDAIEGEGVGKVVYIHSYPEELKSKLGIKCSKT